MAEREGNSAGNTLLAFALGALAGAAIALLYAPASGEETRRKLRRRARQGRDRVSELVNEGRDRVADVVNEGREVFERAVKEHL